jgi:GT2 family glycosyltransferase
MTGWALRGDPDTGGGNAVLEGAEKSFERGRRRLEAGDRVLAGQWLQRCLQQDPRHGAAWHLLGRLAAEAGDSTQALTFQRLSCDLHPHLGWNWFAAAELLEERGEWKQAADHLETAVRWLPQEAWIQQRALRARNRFLLEGEDPAQGLGPAAYRYWVRRLEPPLPSVDYPLGQRWWLATPSGWKPLGPGEAAASPADAADGWLLLLAPDALLRPGALQALERAVEAQQFDVLYADEDRLDDDYRRCDPWFKPGWVPESFWSTPWLEAISAWSLSWIRQQGLRMPPGDGLDRWSWQLHALLHQPRMGHVARVLVHRRGRGPALDLEALSNHQQRKAEVLLHALQNAGEPLAAVHPVIEENGAEGFRLEWALPTAPPGVRIVIPSRDRPDLLDACLNSIEATRAALEPHFVLIDHASHHAATAQAIARWRVRLGARMEVLREDGLFHWSRFNNRGVREGAEPLLLFLNDDVEAIEQGWLEAMAAQALRPAIGCVGALLLYPGGSVQHAGILLGFGDEPQGRPEHAFRGLAAGSGVHRGRLRRLSGWPAVTGACLMVRRAVFAEAGGFDERFPVEANDVDFCLRLGTMGFRHLVEPSARLIHRECQSRDPLHSPTAVRALQDLRHRHPAAMAEAGPWWPPACSTKETDGRPREMAGFL